MEKLLSDQVATFLDGLTPKDKDDIKRFQNDLDTIKFILRNKNLAVRSHMHVREADPKKRCDLVAQQIFAYFSFLRLNQEAEEKQTA